MIGKKIIIIIWLIKWILSIRYYFKNKCGGIWLWSDPFVYLRMMKKVKEIQLTQHEWNEAYAYAYSSS
jgi:hypothetical protein